MSEKRKDNKGRVLKTGESQRKDLIYQYRYTDVHGKRQTIYSSDLKELREKEKTIQKQLDDGIDYAAGEVTVIALLERYISLKQGVRYNTKVGYNFVLNLIKKEKFGYRQYDAVSATLFGKEKHVCVHSGPFYGVQRGSAGIRRDIFFGRKNVRKFLRFAQSHPMYSGGSTGLTDFFGVIVSPSISHRNCCGVNSRTSSGVRGHWNRLSESRLYNRSHPSPSHTSPLMRSVRLPQKR